MIYRSVDWPGWIVDRVDRLVEIGLRDYFVPYLRRNLSTCPAVSSIFCLPV